MRAMHLAIACAATLISVDVSGQALTIDHRNQTGAAPIGVSATTPDLMAAHFINVGQGSATLFEFSCGLVLVDTGGQAQAATD